MSLKLIPLYDAQAILNSWFYLEKGLEEVLKYTNGDSSIERVFNELLAGRLLAWVGFLDGNFIGIMTTRVDDIPTCYKVLSIIHLYVKDIKMSDVFFEGMKELVEFAKSQGCSKFRMWTIRDKAFEKVLKPFGWNPGYVEFLKDIA
jgi:hypothetical protein